METFAHPFQKTKLLLAYVLLTCHFTVSVKELHPIHFPHLAADPQVLLKIKHHQNVICRVPTVEKHSPQRVSLAL